jgi:GNAT superfamily N-acetyltransferase
MENKLAIRKMQLDDVDFVTGVYGAVLSPSYISFSELAEGKGTPNNLSEEAVDIFRDQLEKLYQSPSHCFLVAKVDDEIIGFALASRHPTEAGHNECWIDDVGVLPAWQNRGIAKKLLLQIFAWGKEAGAKYFLLESGFENDSAHEFFMQIGFQPLATVFWLPESEVR